MAHARLRTTFASLFVIGMASVGQAAPITTNTALPVSENELIFRQQIIWTHAGNDPAGLGREFDAVAGVSVFGYGLTSDFTLFGLLPTRHKQLSTPAGTRSSNGIGDARLFARYTVLRQDQPGQTFRIAPFAGVELPTGRHRKRDALGLLPPPLQPGSGSWDPFAGVVMTYATTDWQLDFNLGYQFNTQRDGRRNADIARADISFQYRLWPMQITGSTNAFVFGVLEANLVHADKLQLNGISNPNSGGTTLFLSPGLQYAAKTFIAEASVQLPVLQDLNGTALEKTVIARASMRFNF